MGLAACRGLSIREGEAASKDSLNRTVLRAFGQTTNHAVSAFMETAEQAASRRAQEQGSTAQTVVGATGSDGGTSGMSEAALGAYRVMAEASVSLGRSDLLYTLMCLSVSHSFWFSQGAGRLYRYVPKACRHV